MAILVDERSRILVQGITGAVGRQFATRLADEGSPVVGGVVPGRGGQSVEGLPVFDTVAEARAHTDADVAIICTPIAVTLDAASEALMAGIGTVVVYTEGVPPPHALMMAAQARAVGATLLGPASAGVASPGRANASDLRGGMLKQGPVGVVSRSGTLTYEVIAPLRQVGIGISTVCCLGGDPVVGTRYAEILDRFDDDPLTEVVVVLGEIGGRDEVVAAETVARMDTPVVAYVAGRHAPQGQVLGHAGAMVTSFHDSAEAKSAALTRSGAHVVNTVVDLAPTVAKLLGGGRLT